MNNAVNNKRVFLVVPHVPIGYLDIVGRRDDVRFDRLENGNPTEAAKSVLAAAHAYQTSSTRDELARHYHTAAELLEHTPNLLIVSTNGAGYDTVDVKACTERGILVVNQAGGNAESVAEHVLGMMLALSKRVVECDRALRAGTLADRAAFTGREAHGKSIGIIGIGNVGRRVAELCRGLFRMDVLAYDPYVDAEETRRRGARKVEFDELLRSADFVSINCPLTDETRGMIDLSTDTRSCRQLFHAFRDDVGQLHHLLTELRVFRNVALDTAAIGVKLSTQRLEVNDKAVDFARRCVCDTAQ